MAIRQNTLLIKRSNIIGKIPPISGLTLGEMALNTADAKLYTLFTSGTTGATEVRQIGWDRISRTGDTVTGDFNVFGDLQISGSSYPSGYTLSVTGDTNFSGDVYVGGDLYYNGNLNVTGNTIIESGLTASTIYTDYIDFNTTASTTTQFGRINWDSGTGTLNVGIGDATTGLVDFQLGQEEVVRVFNDEATTLQKGEIVYVNGSQGNRPSVKRAIATGDGYSVTTLGMVDVAITSGSQGYVTTFGIISNLNTLGLTGGTPVWLSPTTPGSYTTTKPQAPDHTVLIGYVVRVSATVGSIFVNISNGWELDELHDVRISAATEGDLLVRSSYSGSPIWVNTKTLLGSYTITGNTNVGGNLTVSGNTSLQALTATTISATTYQNLPDNVTGNYLPLSGGTVTGNTIFTSGLTGNTLTVTGLTQTKGITSTGGIIFKQVTINSSYTATTDDYMIDVTGGTFNVTLPSAIGQQGRILAIKNNGGGAVTVQPILGQTIDDKPNVILGETNTIQIVSNGYDWVALSYNISTINSSTGVFEFTGITKVSSTQFYVSPVKGWLVDDTTNPLSPQLYYVDYSGGTHTDNYVNTDFETFVFLTSGGTISQQPTPLTEQQRRLNIFLGKIGHPDKTTINLVFSQPDYVLSPLSQLRDIFAPINLINGGVYPSANGTNLKINTSAGYIYGLGINFTNNVLSPNAVSVSGTSPCTFQYRTQTGGTITNVTDIDPLNYDVGGVITPITGTKATNQRIFLLQNGTFRIQYGQNTYNTLALAIEALQTESFIPFPNFTNDAVLIGILTVLSTVTDLTDTTKARFFFSSKFGETVGAAGGVSTTNLQQAYNNSSEPEIIINSTLDGLSIKNGTGNADNVTKLLEGLNTAGSTTSFVRADGLISGSSLNTPGFTANTNGLTATTISATTYQNLPTDISVTGATYSNNTFTFTNNTGGTFGVLFNTVTGLTVNGNLTVTGNTSLQSFTGTTGTINGNLTVTGNTSLQNFTGRTGVISAATQNVLTIIGSGNSTTSPIFTVQGSSGELFSVSDSLTGSLFSVNDISGLPILEVFSDNTTLMGSYLAPSLNTTTRTSLTGGTNTVYSIPTSAYTGAFFEYTLISSGSTGARAGQIMSIWSGSTANFTETTTTDIGTTTGVTFNVAVSGNNVVLSSSATTAGWTLKTIVRSI